MFKLYLFVVIGSTLKYCLFSYNLQIYSFFSYNLLFYPSSVTIYLYLIYLLN